MKRLIKWNASAVIVQPKLDGIRCRAVYLNGEWVLVSSGEHLITSVPHVIRDLNDAYHSLGVSASWLNEDGNIEFDGELYAHGWPLEKINGICSRHIPDSESEGISLHLFDTMGRWTLCADRIDSLRRVHDFFGEERAVRVVNSYTIFPTEETINNSLTYHVDRGYEGIIIRNPSGLYERKRSANLLKFKPGRQDEYLIIGMQEEISESGNPKNALGALICQSGDGKTFRVGTGFTRADREVLWDKRDELINSWAIVKYQQLTAANSVPRHAVFVSCAKERSY